MVKFAKSFLNHFSHSIVVWLIVIAIFISDVPSGMSVREVFLVAAGIILIASCLTVYDVVVFLLKLAISFDLKRLAQKKMKGEF